MTLSPFSVEAMIALERCMDKASKEHKKDAALASSLAEIKDHVYELGTVIDSSVSIKTFHTA